MPLKAPDLLGLARESLPLGEIRIGTSKAIEGKKGRQPVRLDTYRFTTPSRETALAVAELYGGTPAPWERRRGYFEVITKRSAIDVWVPPRGRAVDTMMELWDGGKCKRRCDGETEMRSGQPCMCPRPGNPADPADVERAYNERLRLAKATPPRACSPRTRINVSIPELPGMGGVWKLLTGSANAARWCADSGEVLERARDANVWMPASLEITWWPGQDGNPYPVPILRPRQSAVQVAAGELPSGLNGMLAQLQAGPSRRLALTSGVPAEPGPLPAVAQQVAAPANRPAPSAQRQPQTAQEVADLAASARTRARMRPLIRLARDKEWEGDKVCVDRATDEWQDLKDRLDTLWDALPDDRPPERPQPDSHPGPGPAAPPGPQGSMFDAGEWPEGTA